MTRQDLAKTFADAAEMLASIPEEHFFVRYHDKWSAAENLQHLIISVKPLVGLFTSPRAVFAQWQAPQRAAMGYEELVEKYKTALAGGLTAPARFAPEADVEKGKAHYIQKFKDTHEAFLDSLEGWTDAEKDQYFVPHPAVGLLSVREMVYFTDYHTKHHGQALARIRAEVG